MVDAVCSGCVPLMISWAVHRQEGMAEVYEGLDTRLGRSWRSRTEATQPATRRAVGDCRRRLGLRPAFRIQRATVYDVVRTRTPPASSWSS